MVASLALTTEENLNKLQAEFLYSVEHKVRLESVRKILNAFDK
jgi:hypothetical protein